MYGMEEVKEKLQTDYPYNYIKTKKETSFFTYKQKINRISIANISVLTPIHVFKNQFTLS